MNKLKLIIFNKKLYLFLTPIIIYCIILSRLFSNPKIKSIPIDEQIFFKKISFFLTLIFIIFFLIFCFFLFIKKKKLETIYLLIAPFLGIIYIFLIPPYVVPDEIAHIQTAYLYSNNFMGIVNNNDEIYMRNDDINTEFNSEPTLKIYQYMHKNLFNKIANDKLVKTKITFLKGNSYLYIFSAIGISFARLFNCSTVLTFIMGRLFNLLAYITISYYALKHLPFGKLIMFCILLFPMSLQQASSCSYDAMINAIAFLTISLSLYLGYENLQNIAQWKLNIKIVLFLFFTILLSFSKGGVYLPITIGCIFASKNFLTSKKNKTIYICLFLITIVLLSLYKNKTAINGTVSITNTEHFIEWAGEVGYTIPYVFHHIYDIIKLYFNTILQNYYIYIATSIGSLLGWLDINISPIIIRTYILLTLVAIFINQDKNTIKNISIRFLFFTFGIASIFLCMTALLFGWTPRTSPVILGVQGRYFIPIIPFLAFSFHSLKYKFKYNLNQYCIYIGITIQFPVFINILENVL